MLLCTSRGYFLILSILPLICLFCRWWRSNHLLFLLLTASFICTVINSRLLKLAFRIIRLFIHRHLLLFCLTILVIFMGLICSILWLYLLKLLCILFEFNRHMLHIRSYFSLDFICHSVYCQMSNTYNGKCQQLQNYCYLSILF